MSEASAANRLSSHDEVEHLLRVIKTQEEELAHYRTAFQFAGDAVVMVDAEGVFTHWNREAEALFEYSEHEMLGQRAWVLIPEDYTSEFQDVFARLRSGEPFVALETVRVTKSGVSIDVRMVVSPVRSPTGDVKGMVAILRDIRDQKEAARQLLTRNSALERANRDLQDFAYVASHDLKEPLRGVVAYSELLVERYGAEMNETARRFADNVAVSARRMQHLINDLLEYSRVDRQEVAFDTIDLQTLVDESVLHMQPTVQATNATITATDLPLVVGSAAQIRQVVQNLLTNAIKFSGDKPPVVAISAERSGEFWTIRVRDEGIGMDSSAIDRIFEMFQRLHTQSTYEGTGIGLAIVKRVVERHGGKVGCTSRLGEGTTFWFTLPAVKPVD